MKLFSRQKDASVEPVKPAANKASSEEAELLKKREEARQCLVAADRYIKDALFDKAKIEVERAITLDPSNAYVYAFQDRIKHFEKERPQPVPEEHPPAPTAPATAPSPEKEPESKPTAQIKSTPKPPPQTGVISKMSTPVAPPAKTQPQPTRLTQHQVQREEHVVSETARAGEDSTVNVGSMVNEMKNRIDESTMALENEKKAREEISKRSLLSSVFQLRTALEKAWVNGAPKDAERAMLHTMAVSLSIPQEVEQSLEREVKIEMYSRAVQEVVARRKLLRSSSSTLDWLRKVYQLSVTDYLENESRFLLDLVANQYRGSLLLVSKSEESKKDLLPRLKEDGYAVVYVETPETGLEKIEKIHPNVILCETHFGGGSLSGIKFLHILRANPKFNFVPFVFLCKPSEVDQLKSSELRPNEVFLSMPVEFGDLSLVLSRKLEELRTYISSLNQ